MIKNILFTLLFYLILNIAFGQHEETEGEKESKHLITVALGYSFIPQGSSHGEEADGIFIPSIGVDYFYRLSPRWEIGTMIDMELGEYLVFEKELDRKNALVISLIASYRLTPHINLFAGGGIELERTHNLGIIRLGGEYAFKFKKGWMLAPGFFYDFKEGYDTWSLALAVGKEF